MVKLANFVCQQQSVVCRVKIGRICLPLKSFDFIVQLEHSILDEKIAQLICSYAPKYADQLTLKSTTSKLLTCGVTNGGPIWFAFYVVLQSKNKAT